MFLSDGVKSLQRFPLPEFLPRTWFPGPPTSPHYQGHFPHRRRLASVLRRWFGVSAALRFGSTAWGAERLRGPPARDSAAGQIFSRQPLEVNRWGSTVGRVDRLMVDPTCCDQKSEFKIRLFMFQ